MHMPEIIRFIKRSTVWVGDDLNLYAYVKNVSHCTSQSTNPAVFL